MVRCSVFKASFALFWPDKKLTFPPRPLRAGLHGFDVLVDEEDEDATCQTTREKTQTAARWPPWFRCPCKGRGRRSHLPNDTRKNERRRHDEAGRERASIEFMSSRSHVPVKGNNDFSTQTAARWPPASMVSSPDAASVSLMSAMLPVPVQKGGNDTRRKEHTGENSTQRKDQNSENSTRRKDQKGENSTRKKDQTGENSTRRKDPKGENSTPRKDLKGENSTRRNGPKRPE